MKYLLILSWLCFLTPIGLVAQEKSRDSFKERLKEKRRKVAKEKARIEALNKALLNQFRVALRNADVKIRKVALTSLMKMKNKINHDLIIKSLEDDSSDIRMMVLDYFVKEKSDEHLSSLSHLTSDSDINVRKKLVEVVLAYTVSGYDTFSLMQNMMEDKQSAVRMAIVEGVDGFNAKLFKDRRLFDSVQSAYSDTDMKIRMKAYGFIHRFDFDVTHDYLETALNDTQNKVRRIAQKVVGGIQDKKKRAIKLLIKTLNDNYNPIRSAAIDILGKRMDEDIVRILDNHILGEQNYKLRIKIIQTISKKPSTLVINVVSRSLTDTVANVRLAAAKLLQDIQKKVNRKK